MTTTNRKSLSKRKEALTPTARQELRSTKRSEILTDPRADEYVQRLYQLALGKIEDASGQEVTLAMKLLGDVILGTEQAPKTQHAAIQINITGIGSDAEPPKDITTITIDGDAEAKEFGSIAGARGD